MTTSAQRSRRAAWATLGFVLAVGSGALMMAQERSGQQAQLPQGTSAPAAFEVASVKPLPDLTGLVFRVENGNLKARMGLSWLIGWAYEAPPTRVEVPEWAVLAGFDIEAKAGAPVPEGQVRLMLRTLLGDRFHLAVHRETRQTAMMTLTVAKTGAHMTPSETEGRWRRRLDVEKLRETYTGITMKEFTDFLAQYYHGTVDRTGLSGRYDFVLDYRGLLDPLSERAENVAVIDCRRDALQQVGLRLDPVKQAVELLVVDHVDKLPTEN